jgi:hypothetical protein
MRLPLLALQKAVYDRLRAGLPCPVYDEVPEGAEMPYVVLGEDTAVDWSTFLVPGVEVTQTLHVWSDYEGMAEVKQIIDQMVQALTGDPLIVEGFTVVVARLDMVEALRDPGGFRHGVVRFRFKVAEAI